MVKNLFGREFKSPSMCFAGWSVLMSKIKADKPMQTGTFKPSGLSTYHGPSDWSRTSLTLVPNGWTKFFVVVCGGFRCFPLGSWYSLTALNPLFPGVPVLGVVKYVVRKHFSARPGGHRRPWLRSAFLCPRWRYSTSKRAVNQVVSENRCIRF